jgi:amphi-Trp domain-containing protein
MSKKSLRDIEKVYSKKQFIEKLRRLAEALEKDKNFSIQIAGERIFIPQNATINIEHEREKDMEEIEFQIKWKNK